MIPQKKVFLSKPDISPLEKSHVLGALESGWVSSVGPDVEGFERDLCNLSGRRYAVAVSSGTAALHLALLSLGVNAGEIVYCPTMTFVATANAISYVGARPVFIDVEPETGNISPIVLRSAMQAAKERGQKIGAVIPVDLFGKMASYEELLELCKEFEVPLVSDSAESVGSTRSGTPAGKYGHAAIFSFNGNKIVTTSGGGVIVSDDEGFINRARHLATQARKPTLEYHHEEVGYNYRLSNVLAAIGRAQLSRLEEFVEKRRSIRQRYFRIFGQLAGVSFLGGLGQEDNCWLTTMTVDSSITGWSSFDLIRHLAQDQIESRPLWKPMHLQPAYKENETYLDGTAERLFARGIALPSGSSMDDQDWQRIEESVRVFLGSRE